MALSAAFGWLYTHTRGSLLLAMLMHSAWNQATFIVPTQVSNARHAFELDPQLITWVLVTILWVAAAYFLARMPRVGELQTGKTVAV
jgi:membrane protease YdiL (CAAX protease family)